MGLILSCPKLAISRLSKLFLLSLNFSDLDAYNSYVFPHVEVSCIYSFRHGGSVVRSEFVLNIIPKFIFVELLVVSTKGFSSGHKIRQNSHYSPCFQNHNSNISHLFFR